MELLDVLNVLPQMMGTLMGDFQSSVEEINETQQRVLLLLSETDDVTMTMVSHMMNMEKGSMTPVIDKLITLGFLEREQNPEDRRKYILMLTENGIQVSEKLTDEINVHMKKKFSVLSGDVNDQVMEAFSTIQQAMELIEKGNQL